MTNEYVQKYYNAVVAAKRINGPSYDEAAKDLARANARVLVF